MDTSKRGNAAIEETIDSTFDAQCKELNDLQLSMVGGGMGDVHVG